MKNIILCSSAKVVAVRIPEGVEKATRLVSLFTAILMIGLQTTAIQRTGQGAFKLQTATFCILENELAQANPKQSEGITSDQVLSPCTQVACLD